MVFRICYIDVIYVFQCHGLQSTTTRNIWYCQGWKRECIFVPSQARWDTRFWSPIPTIRWTACSGLQRPSIRTYQTLTLLRLQMWVHVYAVESDLMRNQILISYSYPHYFQMAGMFSGASAFNQDLSDFDTAKVEDVSTYLLCRVWLEKPDSDLLFLPK